MRDKFDTFNRFLNALLVTSSYGGLYYAILLSMNPNKSVFFPTVNFLGFLLAGILAGRIAVNFCRKKIKLIKYDENGDIRLGEQYFVFTVLLIFPVSYEFNILIFETVGLYISAYNSGLYLLGLIVGLYDYTYGITKKLSLSGLAPLAMGTIFLATSNDQTTKGVIWGLMFIFVFTSILALSRLNLYKRIFSQKDINVKDAKSIFGLNTKTVIGLTGIGIFIIVISRYCTFLYRWAASVFSSLYYIASKFTEWMYSMEFIGTAEESEIANIPQEEISIIAIIIFIFIGVILAGTCILGIIMLIKYLLTIKFERNNRLRSHRFENEEYEEETYFDKT
ncbi:MAG: hypothetical protein JXN10_08585, partial [Clostridia bacterium]|nr:hypothetical protein [Clostridia bacterium]